MKKVLVIIFAGIVVVFVVRGVLLNIERSKASVITIEDLQEETGIPVITAQAEVRDIKSTLSYTGTVRGIEQADVTAAVQIEKVLDIAVAPGQRVKQGEVLLTLDTRITGAYRQTTDALADAQQDLQRIRELYKVGAVSRQSLDKAELAVNIAQANMDAAEWRHKVASPIGGTVTDIFVEKGQTVLTGIPLVRVAQLDRVIADIQAAESDIARIKKGQTALVHLQTYPGREFTGRVREVALSANPKERNFKIEIEIPNSGRLLKPGMFARVDLVVDEMRGATAVPYDALVKDNGAYYVFIVKRDMTVKKTAVAPQQVDSGWVGIPNGISPGESVVVEGHNKLTDGAKVTVVSQ